MFSSDDYRFMALALRLAERGLYTTSPNPRVGCVIVVDGGIVGEGWHERAGEPHAEINALRQAGGAAQGATAYVTLEPCSHHGRTPPCADALAAAGVARVVTAMEDPNPLVAGAGLRRLREAGIRVESGLLQAEAAELNLGFVSRMTRGRPWIRIKTASSLDGKTALEDGTSFWITGDDARRDGHHFRARSCAVLTGLGTILADDPQMTVRAVETSRQPLRVVVDSALRMPSSARILAGGNILVAGAFDDRPRIARLEDAGAEVVLLPGANGRVDLAALAAELGRRGMNEVLVESGATLNGALLQAGLVDELLMYFAPSLMGDRARGLFALPALAALADQHRLHIRDAARVGDDLRILARLAV